MRSPFLSPISKFLFTAIVLLVIGGGGLLVLFFFTEPTLGPRWLFFFFLTLVASAVTLPLVYLIQRRIAHQRVADGVIIREAILFGIFIDLMAWLQLGRVLNGMIAIFLAVGFIVLEVLLRLSETALFKPDESGDE
jgi:hypothetical protein